MIEAAMGVPDLININQYCWAYNKTKAPLLTVCLEKSNAAPSAYCFVKVPHNVVTFPRHGLKMRLNNQQPLRPLLSSSNATERCMINNLGRWKLFTHATLSDSSQSYFMKIYILGPLYIVIIIVTSLSCWYYFKGLEFFKRATY
jgi:hypothetical protein